VELEKPLWLRHNCDVEGPNMSDWIWAGLPLVLAIIYCVVFPGTRLKGRWKKFTPKKSYGVKRPTDIICFDLLPDGFEILNDVRRGRFTNFVKLVKRSEAGEGFGGYHDLSKLPYHSTKFKNALRDALGADKDRALLVGQRRETTQRLYDHFEYDLETKSFDIFLMPDNRYVEFSGEVTYSANMLRD